MPEENGGAPPKLLHCTGGKLPDGYSAVVSKAMRYNPSDRYKSVEELQADLTACQNGYPATAEEAGWIRQLQLLLGRRRREALIVVGFLIFSQLLLTYFLSQIAKDRRNLRASETALAESNQDLKTSNQRLEQIVYQLRNTAEINYRDAEVQLRKKRPTQALAQINLALVGGVAESGATRARYLIIRGHANTQLGFYTEALEDYRQAAAYAPDSIPFDEIEKDLTRVLEDGIRPSEGWSWERVDVPNTGKLKQQLKSVNDMPPVKKTSQSQNTTGQEN
jgi:tetratricopeptide (TPR) repeat protein